MRTTLNIDDDLLQSAQALCGVKEKTALVREGLTALIERESARRLARLGGSEPQLEPIPRRQSILAHDPGRYLHLDRSPASRRRAPDRTSEQLKDVVVKARDTAEDAVRAAMLGAAESEQSTDRC